MKVLYIGPYRQADRWGELSRIFIKNLREAEIEFMLRPISYTPSNLNIDQEEESNILDYDCIIQHCLPKDFTYVGGKKNIFFFDQETCGYEQYNMKEVIALCDELWVTEVTETEAKEFGHKLVKLNLYDELYNQLSIQANDNANSLKHVLDNNTVYFCNANLETNQTLSNIKDAFSIEYFNDPTYKLLLYCSDIKATEKALLDNSTTLHQDKLRNVIFVGHDSGITEEFLIKHSNVVITTPPFMNINFTLIKSIQLGIPVITSISTQLGNAECGITKCYSHMERCLIDYNKKGTADFGNTDEFVPMTSVNSIIQAMRQMNKDYVSHVTSIINTINEIKKNNLKELL